MKQFVTDNMFIVVMVAIVAVALIGVVFPVLQISAANESAAKLAEVDNQLLSAGRNAESPDWNVQSEDGLRKIREIQEGVIKRALKFATRQPLLLGDKLVFPEPDLVVGARHDFQRAYHDGLDKLLKDVLEAGALPSQREINEAIAAEEAIIRRVPGREIPRNLADTVRANLVAKRAQEIRIWATRSSFDDIIGRAAGASTVQPRMGDEALWAALLNWWIQRDVAEVIGNLNRQSFRSSQGEAVRPASVLHSPVKELVWVRVDRGYFPQQVAGSVATPLTLTGRVTNERYHVMHYSFQVVMDPARFNELLGALQTRNFHTVLSFRAESIDRKGAQQPVGPGGRPAPVAAAPAGPGQGQPTFEYGNNNVAVYTLNCEAIFMNSPASWRGQNEQERRRKRLDFLREEDNRKLVLEVHELLAGRPRVALSYAQLRAEDGPARLDELLESDNQNLQFIFLYEDLMPREVKRLRPEYSR